MSTDLENMTFGEAVRHYRLERGLKMQFELADAAKMPVATISAIETGRHVPSRETGERFIKVLVGKDTKGYRTLIKKLDDALAASAVKPYEKFGELLRYLLEKKKADIKQIELSRILGLKGPQAVGAWCDGRQAPSADIMREIVKALRDSGKVSVEEIEKLKRARWVEIFMVESQSGRLSDMKLQQRKAVAKFIGDLDI